MTLTLSPRSTRALCVVTAALFSLAADPVTEQVYELDDYQLELPGQPGSCQGSGCDPEIVSSGKEPIGRARGARAGLSQQGGRGGGDQGEQSGSVQVRGEFERAATRPTCELRHETGGAPCQLDEIPSKNGSGLGQGGGSGEGSGEGGGLDSEGGGSGEGGSLDNEGGGSGEEGIDEGLGSGDGLGSEGAGNSSGQGLGDEGASAGGSGSNGEASPPEPLAPEEAPSEPQIEEPEEVPDAEIPEVERRAPPLQLEQVARALIIVLGVVLLMFALAWIGRGVLRRLEARRAGLSGSEQDDGVSKQGGEQLIEELRERVGDRSAEQWASEERYEEAIHALLFGAIKRALADHPELNSPSLTSRELLAQVRYGAEAHAALTTLVNAAELCVFARRRANQAMYQACQRADEALCASPSRHTSGGGVVASGEAS